MKKIKKMIFTRSTSTHHSFSNFVDKIKQKYN
jgi:hypothetical protein